MSAAQVSSAGPSSTGLVKTANGEYTAASVDADQQDAIKLALVKQKDGNYAPALLADQSAATKSSTDVQAALLGLTLGG